MQPSNIEDIYPLSPMQKGILFHTLYDPAADHYFRQWSGLLRGGLVVVALERAWQEVVDRHSILRTAFVWDEVEDPMQVVCRRVRLPREERDWRGLAAEEQERRLAEYLRQDRERGFDLAQSPLMRLALFQVDDAAYQMVWSFHHLLLDGWSVALVMRRLMSYYRAICLGEPLPPTRSRPFRDYIAWLKSQDLRQAEEFWRRSLQGISTPTRLGIDLESLPPAGLSETGGEERTVLLSAPVTTALRELARQHQVTFNTLTQGLWALLLGRYSGEEDVVFGATVSGRPTQLPGFESMVGLFINTLPVRVRLPEDAQLLAWLRDLQDEQAAARQYDYSPLVDVQGWSEVPRGIPLFHTILVFENYQVEEPSPERDNRLQLEASRFRDGTHYPLTLIVRPRAERLGLRILWDSRRFEDVAMERLLGQLAALFEGLVAHSEARLGDLPWIPEAERHQLLVEWNDSATEPSVRCVHELIAEQVARVPERPAVTCEGESLTYGDLDAAANRLANRLCALGVGPGTLVGIAVERSPRMLIGLLGILKTGGAYVPLDPWYPIERLAFMLEDSGAPVLVTEERWAAAFQGCVRRVLCLDRDQAEIAAERAEPPASPAHPDSLAYVIYTSGSTGRPKGVQVPHAALSNFLASMRARPGLNTADRLLAVTSLSFDIASLELFLPLLVGAEIELVSRGTAADGTALLARLDRATMLQATPATWRLLLEAGWVRSGGLKALCGGEALPGILAREIAQRAGSAWNMYGPTETAVWSATRVLSSEDGDLPGSTPLGRPIANTRLHVLDRGLRPLPVGVPGDLYIGGAGLAHGYLGRPDLTAEKFLPDPFAGGPGARLYQTGDLARWLGTGEIEFLGRTDHQVKVRGFRIELGEIEAVLARHSGVRDAVALAREVQGASGAAGERRLIAYLVAKPGFMLQSGALRSALLESLPEYMVPSAWVFLESLPLTPNGKVDRRALPDPGAIPSSGAVAPRTWVEELLAEVWSEVLKVEGVGCADDFFALGGHSLLATQVVSRVRRVFGVELALRELFEAPRLAALAERIERALRVGHGTAVPPLVPAARGGRLPLSFSQQRLWFLDQLEPGSSVYNMPVALRLEGALRIEVLAAALAEIARRHESLRTRFERVDGEPVQVIEEPGRLRLPVVDLGSLARPLREREARRLAREEARRPFDLGRGPLLRTSLVRLGPEEHALLATLHHSVSDGWSMGVLRREMGALYRAFAAGEPSPLPELAVQYADYAAWQRGWLSGAVLDAEVSHWRERLAGVPLFLELPWDRPRPAVRSPRGARESVRLSSALSQALAALARREGSTSFMTLLAAFQTLLSRLSGQPDVSVGIPVAGRTRMETENLIGFFVNTLVLRTDLSGDPPFRELLRQVRETALQAHAHQNLPFDKLVEELAPQRSLSYTPLFQVLFVVQNAPREDLDLPGVRLRGIEGAEEETTKFDLTLGLTESREGLRGSLEYSTDLFDGSTMRRWLNSLETLLSGVVAEPGLRLSDLPLLNPAERAQLLVEWCDTGTAYPSNRPIHELFEEQAARTPEGVAVVFGADRLSYRDLDLRATRLASRLRNLGVGPEVAVALCLERSTEMVVGLLAVLKAGGYYVPLDLQAPPRRLASLIEDAGAAVLLVQEKLAARLPEMRAAVLCLDAEGQGGQGDEGERGSVASWGGAGADNLAYVMYTSGSTGQPKGVGVEHRAVVRLVRGNDFARLDPSAVFLQLAPLAFDASTLEIWGPLLNGGSLVIPPAGPVSLEQLGRMLRDHSVTTLWLTAGLFHQMVEERPEDLAGLRELLAGGDVLSPDRVRKLLAQGGPVRLINGYGPTEGTTFTCCHAMEGAGDLSRGSVPIGRPIRNSRVLVLDRSLRSVPIGAPGELFAGGDGLARGYHAHADWTAERFLPDPFGTPGGRLYRTGDRVRWQPDGTLEFLGRIDQQVKIRGFRIEPGEIEAALLRYPGVREAAVLVREDNGDKLLVAYVVPAGDRSLASPGGLRDHLRTLLPDYMMPAAWVELSELPLNANGKLDRRALPAPGGQEPGTGYVAPGTPTEEALAAIWAEVLGRKRVGSHDNFFDLGGHSLKATQVVSRIRETFGVELPLRQLFEQPTVAALASCIEISDLAALGGEEELESALTALDALSDEEVLALMAERGELAEEREP
jgi:amino acid adenylation domain-containing protein